MILGFDSVADLMAATVPAAPAGLAQLPLLVLSGPIDVAQLESTMRMGLAIAVNVVWPGLDRMASRAAAARIARVNLTCSDPVSVLYFLLREALKKSPPDLLDAEQMLYAILGIGSVADLMVHQ
jgi:hypothetical protein